MLQSGNRTVAWRSVLRGSSAAAQLLALHTRYSYCIKLVAFLFSLRLTPRIPPDCSPTLLSISVFYFLVFLFPFLVLLLVPCGRSSWLMSAFGRTLGQHLVSYRIPSKLQFWHRSISTNGPKYLRPDADRAVYNAYRTSYKKQTLSYSALLLSDKTIITAAAQSFLSVVVTMWQFVIDRKHLF